jgi:hypothetical protein
MAHRDLGKRRGGGTLKQGAEFRMQALATRCGESAELMESGQWLLAVCRPHKGDLRRVRHLTDREEIAVQGGRCD